MKIAYAGTPDFAVPALKGLIQNADVVGVWTQPDRPAARQKINRLPVKQVALEAAYQSINRKFQRT